MAAPKGIRIIIPMTTDILTLTQWFSPAYPVGAFVYSHGLETAIGQGWVDDRPTLQSWLYDILTRGSGRNDCILLRAAYQGHLPLAEINAIGLAFAASAERRYEGLRQGAAFAKVSSAICDLEPAEVIYPVAVGSAAGQLGIDPSLTCAMYLQSMVSNLIAAAQRLMALGQTEGQATLSALAPVCVHVADQTATATLDDLSSTAFLSDIASMKHEIQSPRIFQT